METLPALAEKFKEIEIKKDEDNEQVIVLGGDQEVFLAEEPLQFRYYNPQSLAGDTAKINRFQGMFHFPFVDEVFESLRVIPICELRITRTLWDSDGRGGASQSLCSSRDGENPSPNVENPISPEGCGKLTYNNRSATVRFEPYCSKAKFGPTGERPACSESRFVIFLDTNLLAPIGIWLNGQALGEWNKFARNHFSSLYQKKFFRNKEGKQGANVIYNMSLSPQKNRTALVWERDSEATVEEINKLNTLAEFYKHYMFIKRDLIKSDAPEPEKIEGRVEDADTSFNDEKGENLEITDL